MIEKLSSLAEELKRTGYHLKQQTLKSNDSWDVFISFRDTPLIDFGVLMDIRRRASYGSYLRLYPVKLRVRQANGAQQDYLRWTERVDIDVEEIDKDQIKIIVNQQYASLHKFRSVLPSFPEGFIRLSEAEQNSKILPFCLAKITANITSLALQHDLPAFHPIVNGLISGKIEMDKISEYTVLPVEWVRKLVY